MTTYQVGGPQNGAMRYTTLLAQIIAALALFAAARPHENQLQQGIELLETKGDIPAAIAAFEAVSKSSDRSLAARALLYLGSCYQKLGGEKAQAAYERIVREFAEESIISPDGKQAAYSWFNKSQRYDLRLIGLSGDGADGFGGHRRWFAPWKRVTLGNSASN